MRAVRCAAGAAVAVDYAPRLASSIQYAGAAAPTSWLVHHRAPRAAIQAASFPLPLPLWRPADGAFAPSPPSGGVDLIYCYKPPFPPPRNHAAAGRLRACEVAVAEDIALVHCVGGEFT